MFTADPGLLEEERNAVEGARPHGLFMGNSCGGFL